MPKDYIPASDGRLVSWSATLAERVGLSPDEYGVSSLVAAELAAKQAVFAAAYAIAVAPETRGGSTVFRKNTARTELIAIARDVVRAAQGVIGLGDQKKYALGITVRKAHRSPTPAIETMPGVRLRSIDGRIMSLQIRDSVSGRRARPAFACGAAIFSHAGPNPSPDIGNWKFEQNTIHPNVTIVFPSALPPGTTVWIAVRWLNANLQPGPACVPLQATIGYGTVLPTLSLAA